MAHLVYTVTYNVTLNNKTGVATSAGNIKKFTLHTFFISSYIIINTNILLLFVYEFF